jgi:hypothetical protein
MTGLFLLLIGISATIIIVDVWGYLPQMAEQLISQYIPWLLNIDGPGVSYWGATGAFGIFAIIGLPFGSYELIQALTQPDYTYTTSPASGDGGGEP